MKQKAPIFYLGDKYGINDISYVSVEGLGRFFYAIAICIYLYFPTHCGTIIMKIKVRRKING